jgi:hypothetical protein
MTLSSSSSIPPYYKLPTKANLRWNRRRSIATALPGVSKEGLNDYQNFLRAQAYNDGQKLAYLAGIRNKGINFRPDWNAGETATRWINKKIEKAESKGDEKLKKYYERWGVLEADMDKDPNTPANVIVYSDYDGQIIKSVDGFYLVPPKRKQTLRGYYTNVPDRTLRSEYASDPILQKKIKAYFKTYQTPTDWREYSFNDFRMNEYKSTFQVIREAVRHIFTKNGLTIYKPPKAGEKKATGSVLLQNYMPLLQKTASMVQNYLIFSFVKEKGYANIPKDMTYDQYNYKTDGLKIKRFAKLKHGQTFYDWIKDNSVINKLYTDKNGLALIADGLTQTLKEFKNVSVTYQGQGLPWKVEDKSIDTYYDSRKKSKDTDLSKFRSKYAFEVQHQPPRIKHKQIENNFISKMMDDYGSDEINPLLRKQQKAVLRAQALAEYQKSRLPRSLNDFSGTPSSVNTLSTSQYLGPPPSSLPPYSSFLGPSLSSLPSAPQFPSSFPSSSFSFPHQPGPGSQMIISQEAPLPPGPPGGQKKGSRSETRSGMDFKERIGESESEGSVVSETENQ